MISFNIDKFAFCDDESKLKLDDLPLLKRRRMGLASKYMHTVLRDIEVDCPLVFSSNYGEFGRSIDLLTNLRGERSVSPTSFSLSVLNSIPAIIAINNNLNLPVFAISAFAAIESGVISAIAKKYEKILILCYEETPFLKKAFAVALKLSLNGNSQLTIAPSINKNTNSNLENFIENYGKDFYFDDGINRYLWRFNADN